MRASVDGVRSSGITVFSNGSFDIFAAAHSVVFQLGGNQIEGQPRKKDVNRLFGTSSPPRCVFEAK